MESLDLGARSRRSLLESGRHRPGTLHTAAAPSPASAGWTAPRDCTGPAAGAAFAAAAAATPGAVCCIPAGYAGGGAVAGCSGCADYDGRETVAAAGGGGAAAAGGGGGAAAAAAAIVK